MTIHAARVAAFKDLGTLGPGAPADIAVLELRDGDFEFVDNVDGARTGRYRRIRPDQRATVAKLIPLALSPVSHRSMSAASTHVNCAGTPHGTCAR